jgi:hypothetical protein
MSRKRLFVTIVLWSCVALWGDVAPTTYDGYTLSPKDNNDIRMQSEEVDIYCGDRCRVVAKFAMENETDKAIAVFVGFPVENARSEPEMYDFTVTINEKNAPAEIKQIPVRGQYDILRWTWFGWDQPFPPGPTIIRVEYHIRPSGSYSQPWLNLYYRLDTGALWKGTIGRADITIHFEEPLATEQIRAGTGPAGFQVEGKEVRWRFTDIEPQLQDNIQIEYIPFPLYRELERLRSRIEENPRDESRVVDLARRYFSLGPYKGVGGDYVWGPITAQDYDAILAKTTDPNDRVAFEEYWKDTEKRPVFDRKAFASWWGHWSRPLPGQSETIHVSSGRQPVYRINHIMGAAGYLPYRDEYVMKAKEMLERLLEKNPKNAEAWMVYITNCYRFVCGAYDLGTRWCPIGPKQREIVEHAYSHCPTDERIKAWHEFVTSKEVNTYPMPQTLVDQLQARLKAMGGN